MTSPFRSSRRQEAPISDQESLLTSAATLLHRSRNRPPPRPRNSTTRNQSLLTSAAAKRNALHWRLLWILFAVFPFFPTDTFAADTLKADLIQPGLRARTAAPIPVEVRFKWDGTRILEGRLEFELHEGGRVLGKYRSAELALTTGEQTFRILLPPPRAPFADSQVEVQMDFVTPRQTLDLGPSSLFIPTASERSLVLVWCDSRVAGERPFGLLQSLFFDRMSPDASDLTRRLLTTSLVRMTPDELPARPLGCTPFDVIVLTAEAFNETRERQLESLTRWVKGGGSLCVFVGGTVQPHQVQFLNELADSTSSAPKFLFGETGSPLPGQKKISHLHSGMGRSVIVLGTVMPDPGVDSRAWREAVAFLWKLRTEHARAVAETGRWKPYENPAEADQRSRRQWGQGFEELQRYTIQPTDLGIELTQRLMPSTVRLIPLPALLATLGLFLLAIGPGDYYLLGLLRRRKYTWVVFPITSIGFMIATVIMANHYLGQRDERRSLIVVDLGSDGTPLRWNRYQLLFAARDKQAVTELKDALWTPLDFRDPAGARYPAGMRVDHDPDPIPPLYEGAVPVQFQAVQTLRQWSPELTRTFSFEPPPVPLLPDWREVEETWPDLQAIRARLSRNRPFEGEVWAISQTNQTRVTPLTMDAYSRGILPVSMLEQLCIGPAGGLRSFVSRISPTGGSNFEDAGGMDLEANETALLIVTWSGDDIVLYRRFFHGN